MINYNANDIQLYLSGKMAAAQMHDFEEAMMNDPMLADAVDGYRFVMDETDIKNDLTKLSQQINDAKATPAKLIKGSFKQWMSIAAGLIVLLSTAVVLYRIFYQSNETKANNIAVVSKKDSAITIQPETKVDSTNLAMNDKATATTPPLIIIPSAKQKTPTAQKNAEPNMQTDVATVSPPVTLNEQIVTEKTTAAASSTKENAGSKPMATEENRTETPALNKFIGRVVDEQNNPLPFANIKEKITGIGTYADINGNFVLLSADSLLTVQTKSIGYGNAQTQIKSNRAFKIVLKDETIIANAPTPEGLYNKNKSRSSNAETEADEIVAAPADGWGNYNIYIANNLQDPELNKAKQAKGSKQVELLFDVNPDGSVTNVKVNRSNCNQCNKEAVRILKDGPRWKSKTGKKETARFTVQF